jgi:DNA primase
VIVEGYFDVIALDQAGVPEAVAPMGTALTEAQLERAWRVRSRARSCCSTATARGGARRSRLCERAMPGIGAMLPGSGQGCSLSVAILPDGRDPDDLARAEGREGVERVLSAAVPLSEFVFDAVVGVAA